MPKLSQPNPGPRPACSPCIRNRNFPSQTTGKIYITACPRCHANHKSSSSSSNEAESCDTFKLVSGVTDGDDAEKRFSGRMSFFHPLSDSIVTFGGFVVATNDKVQTKAFAGERVDRAAVHISRFCHPSGERRAPIHPYFAIISAFTVNLGNILSKSLS